MDDLSLQLLRLALPLVLAALAETVAERSGVINLGIEGMLLVGALAAYLVGVDQGAAALLPAWLLAAGSGAALGALLALFTVQLRCDAIVAGTALHFLCVGGSGLLFERCKGVGSVTTFDRLPSPWPALPYVITLVLVVLVALLLNHTSTGLSLRAAGESPRALAAAGGSATRSRWLALLLAGALAGLAGATLTTVLTGQFVEGMSNGRGFLALSLVLFARWNPFGAVLAGLFLAATFVLEIQLGTRASGEDPGAGADLLAFLIRALPYLLTIAALAVVPLRRFRAPAALGRSE